MFHVDGIRSADGHKQMKVWLVIQYDTQQLCVCVCLCVRLPASVACPLLPLHVPPLDPQITWQARLVKHTTAILQYLGPWYFTIIMWREFCHPIPQNSYFFFCPTELFASSRWRNRIGIALLQVCIFFFLREVCIC